MESILGLSARYIPPATARAKLKHVTEDREKLDDNFKQKIEVPNYHLFKLESVPTFVGTYRC